MVHTYTALQVFHDAANPSLSHYQPSSGTPPLPSASCCTRDNPTHSSNSTGGTLVLSQKSSQITHSVMAAENLGRLMTVQLKHLFRGVNRAFGLRKAHKASKMSVYGPSSPAHKIASQAVATSRILSSAAQVAQHKLRNSAHKARQQYNTSIKPSVRSKLHKVSTGSKNIACSISGYLGSSSPNNSRRSISTSSEPAPAGYTNSNPTSGSASPQVHSPGGGYQSPCSLQRQPTTCALSTGYVHIDSSGAPSHESLPPPASLNYPWSGSSYSQTHAILSPCGYYPLYYAGPGEKSYSTVCPSPPTVPEQIPVSRHRESNQDNERVAPFSSRSGSTSSEVFPQSSEISAGPMKPEYLLFPPPSLKQMPEETLNLAGLHVPSYSRSCFHDSNQASKPLKQTKLVRFDRDEKPMGPSDTPFKTSMKHTVLHHVPSHHSMTDRHFANEPCHQAAAASPYLHHNNDVVRPHSRQQFAAVDLPHLPLPPSASGHGSSVRSVLPDNRATVMTTCRGEAIKHQYQHSASTPQFNHVAPPPRQHATEDLRQCKPATYEEVLSRYLTGQTSAVLRKSTGTDRAEGGNVRFFSPLTSTTAEELGRTGLQNLPGGYCPSSAAGSPHSYTRSQKPSDSFLVSREPPPSIPWRDESLHWDDCDADN
eukprot:GHVQ01032971.1.p1 GENE.GHVQ01032971.1~~GHVQ01032971.1.p1  ORF type:complete len:651 (+),score=69.34 GHVQ01032971.1:1507-3459(+)